jgi:hypothetical protein
MELDNLSKRIKELERWKQISIEKNIQDIARIKELESKVAELESFKHVRFSVYETKPHKCPNCDFSGTIQLDSLEELSRFDSHMKTADGRFFIWCIACDGKGIVWG